VASTGGSARRERRRSGAGAKRTPQQTRVP